MKGGGAMRAILRRICEVAVHYNFTMYLYIGLANQQEYEGGGAMSAILRRISELAAPGTYTLV